MNVDCGNGIYTLEARALLLWLDHSAISSPSEIFFAFVGDTDEESEICQKRKKEQRKKAESAVIYHNSSLLSFFSEKNKRFSKIKNGQMRLRL